MLRDRSQPLWGTRGTRASTSLLMLSATMFGLGGCIGGEKGEGTGADTLLVSDGSTEDVAYSMALDSIDAMTSDESEDIGPGALVVPTDRALLALDADRLAELAAEGGIDSLIVQLQRSDDVDLSSPTAIDGAEITVLGSDGVVYWLRAASPAPTFADQPIQSIVQRGGLTIIVVDGIVEP